MSVPTNEIAPLLSHSPSRAIDIISIKIDGSAALSLVAGADPLWEGCDEASRLQVLRTTAFNDLTFRLTKESADFGGNAVDRLIRELRIDG